MKTSSAKAKGRKLQQLVRDAILEAYPQLTKDDVRSTSMGASGVDILLSSAAKAVFPYSVECKSHASMAVYKMYEQAVANATSTPLLIIKQNQSVPLAVLELKDFMKLLNANR